MESAGGNSLVHGVLQLRVARTSLKIKKSIKAKIVVIPAQAGIQYFTGFLDARVRGHDNVRLLQAILR
ncbi:MAG: hypothetical protein PVH38_01635 [Gammaproteobacteria bacterium]|jgi:hypothetical protein